MRSSILRRIWLSFMAQYLFFSALLVFTICFSDFQLCRPKYHGRDFISRNAHLVHQNWYRISFTLIKLGFSLKMCLHSVEYDKKDNFFFCIIIFRQNSHGILNQKHIVTRHRSSIKNNVTNYKISNHKHRVQIKNNVPRYRIPNEKKNPKDNVMR
jgi:hypothetical protein